MVGLEKNFIRKDVGGKGWDYTPQTQKRLWFMMRKAIGNDRIFVASVYGRKISTLPTPRFPVSLYHIFHVL